MWAELRASFVFAAVDEADDARDRFALGGTIIEMSVADVSSGSMNDVAIAEGLRALLWWPMVLTSSSSRRGL